MNGDSDKKNETDKQKQENERESISSDKENTPKTTENRDNSSKEKVQNEQETENLALGNGLASNNTATYPGKQSDVISDQLLTKTQVTYSENQMLFDVDRSTQEGEHEGNTMDSTGMDAVLCATINDLNAQIKPLHDSLSVEKKHNKELNEELKKCRDEKNKAEKEITELRHTEVSKTRENEELNSELQRIKTELSEEKSNRVRQVEELEKLKSSNSGLERDKGEWQQKYKKLQETLDELQQKYHENNDELCSKYGSNVDLHIQLEHLADTKAKLEKEVENLTHREITLQRKSDDLNNQLKACQTELSKEKDINSRQSQHINTLRGEKRELQEEIKRPQDKEGLATGVNANTELLTEIETLKTELIQARRRYDTTNKELQKSKQEHKSSTQINTGFSKQIQELTSTNTKLKGEYKKLKEEKENFQSWYYELQTKLKTADNKISDLENEKRVSESQFSRGKNELKKKEDECLRLKHEKEKFIDENEELKKEVQRLNQKITNISSNIDSLKEQKENYQSWFHDAEKAKRSADAELKKTKELYMNACTNRQALQNTVSEKESTIRKLSEEIKGKNDVHQEHVKQLTQSFADKEKGYNDRHGQIVAFIQDLQLTFQYKEEECKQHTAELEKLKQENLVLSEFIPMHKQQFQQLEDERKEIIGQFENMKEQKEHFQKLYHESDTAQRKNAQQVKEDEAFVQKLQSEKIELTYSLSVREGKITDLQNVMKEMEENYKAEIQRQKAVIDQYMVEMEAIQLSLIPIIALQEANSELQDRLDYTKNELEQTRKSYRIVSERVTHVVTNLKQKRDECMKYQTENNKIKRCNELLTQQVRNLESAKESLTRDLMQQERQRLGFSLEDQDYSE